MEDSIITLGLIIIGAIEVITTVVIYMATVRKDDIKDLKKEIHNHIDEVKTDLCKKFEDLKKWIDKIEDRLNKHIEDDK